MAVNPLQISQRTNLIKGGYGRINGDPAYACSGSNCFTRGTNCNLVEVVDDTCGDVSIASPLFDVPMNGSLGRIYSWRDSDAAMNSDSARGEAYVLDNWSAVVNADNSITVTLTSTLQRITRGDIRGNAYGQRIVAVMNSGRGLLWRQNGSCDIRTFNGNVFTGNLSSSVVFNILPQQTSASIYPIIIRNWVTGAADWNWGVEPFVDEMAMGGVFKNNLPNSFDPPEVLEIVQTPRICDSIVDAEFTFGAPILNGGHLELQWHYNGEDWSNPYTVTAPSNRDNEVVIVAQNLIPTSCDITTVYWRARFVSDVDYLFDSEYTYGEFDVLFIPPVWMNVPDISDSECENISSGKPIDEFGEVVYYTGEKPACKKGKC